MDKYLITFPNLFERKKFDELKQTYCTDPSNQIIVHSNRFIEIKEGWFYYLIFIATFPNCKVIKKTTSNKKVTYKCLNKGQYYG